MSGTAASGVLIALLRIATKATGGETFASLRGAALLYFGLASAYVLVALLLYAYYFTRLPVYLQNVDKLLQVPVTSQYASQSAWHSIESNDGALCSGDSGHDSTSQVQQRPSTPTHHKKSTAGMANSTDASGSTDAKSMSAKAYAAGSGGAQSGAADCGVQLVQLSDLQHVKTLTSDAPYTSSTLFRKASTDTDVLLAACAGLPGSTGNQLPHPTSHGSIKEGGGNWSEALASVRSSIL